jgi:diguanylate cyclase (GGDEF)-like protein
MRQFQLLRVDLGRLVLGLALASSVLACANTLYASYRLQRELLIANTLEANRVYAEKLAQSIDKFMLSAMRELAYSAALLSDHMNDTARLQSEALRLQQQNYDFNSVSIIDTGGVVQAVAPVSLPLLGIQRTNPGNREALASQQPRISQPYFSEGRHLLVMLSQPIRGADGDYQGYVAGTIYLTEDSILHTLLGTHYYRDGSYLYVVDRHGQILYHPEPERLGEMSPGSELDPMIRNGATGAGRITNSRKISMLAGYAHIPSSGWSVVSQRPLEATLQPLRGQMRELMLSTFPIALIAIVIVWWLARQIAKPLQQLANAVGNSDPHVAAVRVQSLKPWYFEADRLKRAVLASLSHWEERIGKLNLATLTDPLTGLSNRRGLEVTLEQWRAAGQSFAIVAIDIDHFKRVNDTHGHAVGDTVLQQLAQLMRETSRENDLLCRNGGEEFLILLPGLDTAAGAQVAERLRVRVEGFDMPPVGRITISLGVSEWPASHPDQRQALDLADLALYRAKQQGRNQVVTHSTADRVH